MALRKDDSFLVYRAVLETKNQVAGHPIATGDLCDIPIGEDVAFHRAQHKKSVKQALGVQYGYRGTGEQPGNRQ
jgi:hypothetical protein